jgi:hypothetical protein
LCHRRQYGQRVRGEPGKYKIFDKKASIRDDMLPPGQHKSPGCFTFKERLFKIKHGALEKSFSLQCMPSKKSTADVVEEFVMSFEKIRS